jgi:hypothetical protein
MRGQLQLLNRANVRRNRTRKMKMKLQNPLESFVRNARRKIKGTREDRCLERILPDGKFYRASPMI